MQTPLFALLNLAMLASTLMASGCVYERDRDEPREGYQRLREAVPARREAAGRRSLIWSQSC
jgi:hypothetical protein